MNIEDLAGCEILCRPRVLVGRLKDGVPLTPCILTEEEKSRCQERRQYQAGIKEVVDWLSLRVNMRYFLKDYHLWKAWQSKLKEWGIGS